MNILMQEAEISSDLQHGVWDLAIIGEPLDERGRAAVEFVRNHAEGVTVVR